MIWCFKSSSKLFSAIARSSVVNRGFVRMSTPDPWSPDFHDIELEDVNEELYEKLGKKSGVTPLSSGVFYSPPPAVEGAYAQPITRFMVPLVCRPSEDPSATPIHVWFMVYTGCPFTCMSVKTMKAVLGNDSQLDEDSYWISIHDENTKIRCFTSPVGYKFEHANILGSGALMDLKASLITCQDRFIFSPKI